jgi:2-amino-4-hydroxy-6-hydroxymethyldihydropteridine diphosphokinase
MAEAWIGLGSNQDDPVRQLETALEELNDLPGCRVLRHSRIYRSPPWGPVTDQPDFANAVAELDTGLLPHELLMALQALENDHGRVRSERWGPRTLDLDLLLYDDLSMTTDDLTLPHPRLHERAFVLVPLAELAPDVQVPGHGKAGDLLAGVNAVGVTPWSESE